MSECVWLKEQVEKQTLVKEASASCCKPELHVWPCNGAAAADIRGNPAFDLFMYGVTDCLLERATRIYHSLMV